MDNTACKDCNDLGLIRAISFDKKFQTLVRCQCLKSDNHSSDIPQWSVDISKQYVKSKVPNEFFMPTDETESLFEKIKKWAEKIELARQYWSSVK